LQQPHNTQHGKKAQQSGLQGVGRHVTGQNKAAGHGVHHNSPCPVAQAEVRFNGIFFNIVISNCGYIFEITMAVMYLRPAREYFQGLALKKTQRSVE
jgi:hypothetical protein